MNEAALAELEAIREYVERLMPQYPNRLQFEPLVKVADWIDERRKRLEGIHEPDERIVPRHSAV